MATRPVIAVAVGACLAVAGATASAAPTTAAHQKISTVQTSLGRVLSNPSGRVLYLFEKDTKNKSNCSKACQGIWPEVKSMGAATAGSGVSASHLGRTANGIVTYYGHPLYYYVGDTKAKQTRGEGVPSYGAKWYVVSPKGKPVLD